MSTSTHTSTNNAIATVSAVIVKLSNGEEVENEGDSLIAASNYEKTKLQ